MMNAIAQVRTPWQITKASIYALIIRNLELRFIMNSSKKRALDLLRIFFEPVGHVLLWTVMKVFRYQGLDDGVCPQLFILLGVLPWLFTYNTIYACVAIVSHNRGLLFFKQIKPMDPVIALLLSELGTMALVFCSGLLLFSVWGTQWHIQDPLRWFMAICIYVVFVAGFAWFIATVGFFSKYIPQFFRVVLRVLYLFSGIFFSAQMVSPDLRPYFVINPLFQIIEISRECFSNTPNYNGYGDVYYLFECAIMALALGLGCYVLLRKKMMREIMEH